MVNHLIFNVLNVQISMLRRNTSLRLEAIFYQSLEHKIWSRVSVHDACLKYMRKTITMQGLNPTAISSAGDHTFMIV